MIRACSRCKQTFDPARSGGLCPHCGHADGVPRWAIAAGAVVAAAVLGVGSFLLMRPLFREAPPAQKPIAMVVPDTEFPEAKASIRPPPGWAYQQREQGAWIAFACKTPPYAALRLRIAKASSGHDAHLALIREVVAGAEPVDRALPEWPGAEALAVRLPGDARLGASWLLPRGDGALEILFWGDESRVEDVKAFREGLRLGE